MTTLDEEYDAEQRRDKREWIDARREGRKKEKEDFLNNVITNEFTLNNRGKKGKGFNILQ